MEVHWKHKTLFDGVVVMMGSFHLLMMLLEVIGDAGIRELAVQSDVVAESSIDKVISVKHYNRAVRLHKTVYEALMRVLMQEFQSSLTDESSACTLNEEKHQMEQLKLDLETEEFERVLHSNEFHKWEGQFNAYELDIKEKAQA